MRLNTDKMIAEIEEGIGWVIFNNPAKRNAISLEMWEALGIIITEFQGDENVRVVVLKGAGDKAFVSGADISEFEEKRSSSAAKGEYDQKAAESQAVLYHLDKPLIAMIQGYCMGGGMAIALNADVRIATHDSKFGIPAAKLGLGYAFEGVKTLFDLVGPSYAKDILFSARKIDAEEALHIGLINKIVSRDELEPTVRDYVNMVANNAPLTIKAAKAAVKELFKNPEDRDLGKVRKMVNDCFDSKDYAEGRRAFMEKRKPVFTGK
jgi:enoyl-CoA hydratase/carnithine racemase